MKQNVRPEISVSVFDNPGTAPQTDSIWIKDSTKIQQSEFQQVICQGKLYKKSKKTENFQVIYKYYLINEKFVSQRLNDNSKIKFILLSRARIELIQTSHENITFYGFRFLLNRQFSEFFAKSQDVINKWFEYLSKVCINTDFLQKYTIHERLGKGNFAQVFLVKNIKTNQQYAAKAYDVVELQNSDKLKSSLLNEIFIMRKLDHPSIIKLYEVYEAEQYVYLIIELVKGGELFGRIIKKEKYNEETAGKLMKRLVSALNHMHSKNVIHRDLKLENILLTSSDNDYDIKIADFGLSTTKDNTDLFRKCGTPGYVGPEVLLNQKLSGCAPFPGKSFNEILSKNIRCELKFKAKYWLGVSDSVKKLLQRDPLKRLGFEEIIKHEWVAHADDKNYHASHSFMADVENEEQKILEKQLKQNYGNYLALPKQAHIAVAIPLNSQGSNMEQEQNSIMVNGDQHSLQENTIQNSIQLKWKSPVLGDGQKIQSLNLKNVRKFAIFQNIKRKVTYLTKENKELAQNYIPQTVANQLQLEIDSIVKFDPFYQKNYDQSLLFSVQKRTQRNSLSPQRTTISNTNQSTSDEWNFDEFLINDSASIPDKLKTIMWLNNKKLITPFSKSFQA